MRRSTIAALLWGVLLVVAVAWPSRFLGPFDGAPFDRPLEAMAIGLLLPAVWCWHPAFLRTPIARTLVAALLAWKVLTAILLPQAGWCGTFLTNNDPSIGAFRFAPSWDSRTFWESPLPSCSAIVSRGYTSQTRFPAWIMNIPFGHDRWLHETIPDAKFIEFPKPPNGKFTMHINGTMYTGRSGTLEIVTGSSTRLSGNVDRLPLSAVGGDTAVTSLGPGMHTVSLQLDLTGTAWKFLPLWDGRDVFSAVPTATGSMTAVDRTMLRIGAWVAPALVLMLLGFWLWSAMMVLRPTPTLLASAAAISVCAAWLAAGGESSFAARIAALPLIAAVFVPVPLRLRNSRGAWLLCGMPWLVMIAVRGLRQVGAFTLYFVGDDMLDYQRFAYRIFKEGFWLEGGQATFWNQPLYRWICGALHVFYGDSSVGELFWDGFAILIGAMFAYHVAQRMAGFRAGLVAAVAVLLTVALGPNLYMLGRGLSEVAAAGWLAMSGLCLMRARGGATRFACAGGVFAVLAFLTRLNHLPLVIGLAALLLPLPRLSRRLTGWSAWLQSIPKREAAVYLLVVICGVAGFVARTWYYTGEVSLFAGTTRIHNATGLGVTLSSLWSIAAWRSALDSVLMIVTVSDPPRFDVRALLVIVGVAWAVLWLVRAPVAVRVPSGFAIVCLSALAAGLFVRGMAYPGRFSIHLLPIAVAIAVGSFASLLPALNGRFRPAGV